MARGRLPRTRLLAAAPLLALALVLTSLTACQPGPGLPVATQGVPFTDYSRPTAARGPVPAHAGRGLPVYLWYPSEGAGPWPLVVFAHGYNTNPRVWDRLLRTWASAGYVVAAPEFPISGSDFAGPPRQDDIPNQPGDLSAVITFLLGPQSPLPGKVSGPVAAAGQSDGGTTVAAMALNSGERDPRVSSYLVLSGAFWPIPWGTYDNANNGPLLVVQGSADTVNLPTDALPVFGAAQRPKAYLDVLGGTHTGPYLDATPQADLVRTVTVDWLNFTLRHDTYAHRQFLAHGQTPGSTELFTGGV